MRSLPELLGSRWELYFFLKGKAVNVRHEPSRGITRTLLNIKDKLKQLNEDVQYER
jgi:hypothetical protein